MTVSPRPAENRFQGIALRCGAVFGFAIMAACIKLAALRHINLGEIIFYRNFFSLPVILLWLTFGPGFSAVRTKRPVAHASRAAIGLIAMFASFEAFIRLPLAEATTINFATPLFATMLSALVLAEKVGRHRWIAIAVGLVGVLIVMRPGGNALPVDGLVIAIAAAFLTGCVVVTIRQIGATEDAATTVFWFNMACVLATAVVMPFAARAHTPGEWGILLLMGLSGGAAQIMMTASLRFAPIAALAPFDYFQLLWAVAIGWLLWNAVPSIFTLAGGGVIVAAGLYTLWRERRLHRAARAAPEIPTATATG